MLHYILYLNFFGKNANFIEQLPKKNIYHVKKMPEFDLSIPPSKSTKPVKNSKYFVLKTKYQCNAGFI